jgi:hypothetical protein
VLEGFATDSNPGLDERILHHIEQIIHLEGGNEYIECRMKDTIKDTSIPDIIVERDSN